MNKGVLEALVPLQVVGHVGKVFGYDMDHQTFDLKLAPDGEQLGLEDDLPLRIEHFAPYDDIGNSGLVLKRRKDDATCRTRSLTNKHKARDLYPLSIPSPAQFCS